MNEPKKNATQHKTDDGWLTRERALILVLIVVTAIVFYVCYRLALPFTPALAWALALAAIAHPLHEWIKRHIKRENIAAALAVLVVTVALVAPMIFVARQITREAAASIEKIRGGMAEGRWREAVEGNPRLAPAVRWIESEVDVRGQVDRASENILAHVTRFVSGSLYAVAGLLITLFVLFYFFRDKEKILSAVRSLVPLSEDETDKVFRRVQETIYATIYGTVAVALVQGALGGLMFWWLGLPAPLLWGTVMALLAIVPIFGAFVVWIPAAVFLALEGSWGKTLILTAWGGIVIALIDNLLYPVLVGNKLRLHTVPVFIAIVGGLAVFGAAGVVLGPAALAVAVAVALVDIWRRRTAGGGAAEESQTL